MTLIKALEVVELGTGTVISTIPVDPPADSDLNRIDRITAGLLRNLRDGCYVREVPVDPTDLTPAETPFKRLVADE